MLKILFSLILFSISSFAAVSAPIQANHGMVAADHLLASQAGAKILKSGGNAFDAAVATSLVLSVVRNQSTGIGGGGFSLFYSAKDKKVIVLDYRESAPQSIAEFTERGVKSVGVPGVVKGLYELHQGRGILPWRTLFSEAIRIAQTGYEMDEHLQGSIETLKKFENTLESEFKKVYLEPHSKFKNKELAESLKEISIKGPKVFYEGKIADAIVEQISKGGGSLSKEDLKNYQVIQRTPIEVAYNGHQVFLMPPPSSGGVVIAGVLSVVQMLNKSLAEKSPFKDYVSSQQIIYLTEALKHFFADRAQLLGDPDFIKVPMSEILNESRIEKIAEKIQKQVKTEPLANYGLSPKVASEVKNDSGTTHYVVADRFGNWISSTESVNLEFGSMVWVKGTGIILNNTLDDFSQKTGEQNAFGLLGSERNWIAPRKRPLSSMSPTLVMKDNQVVLGLGGSGGPKIITATLQTLLGVLDLNLNVKEALSRPRIHHQWQPDKLLFEKEISNDTQKSLQNFGYPLVPFKGEAAVQVIQFRNGLFTGASDPRKGGEAAGF